MKLTVKDVSQEVEGVTVAATQEQRTRARRAAAGWKFEQRQERQGGKVTLTFSRRKLGSAEVTP